MIIKIAISLPWLFILGPQATARVALKSIVCAHAVAGTWDFGTAPTGCDVSTLESASLIKSEYASVILDETSLGNGARQTYISQMFPVLRETGKYYIHRRNPQVSPAEEEGFLAGLFSLANQESYWSHYRQGSDGIVRFMRGDNLHGFGLMQIDDRSHLVAIKDGKGADLVENMIYGLDIFYAAWIKSANAKCVASPSAYKSRARAAWSAYNGGMGSICRWSKSRLSASSPDGQFEKKYDQRSWDGLVSNPLADSPVNIACLAEGVRPCTHANSRPAEVHIAEPRLLQPSRGGVATLKPHISYRFLRSCANVTCSFTHGLVRSGGAMVLTGAEEGDWLQVQSESDGHIGWIRNSEIARTAE